MAAKRHPHDVWRQTANRALANGATVKTRSVLDWDISGGCQNPPFVEYHGAAQRNLTAQVAKERSAPYRIDMHVRCRKCEHCLKLRARLWRYRAFMEVKHSSRTWFGTLTLAPEHQFQALADATARLGKKSRKFSQLSDQEQFQYRHNAIQPHITKFFKRVRRKTDAKLRYCLVAEAHKSGLPHYHLLIHETSDVPVRHSILQKEWKLGFSNWKLVDREEPKAVSYVTKYLAKSSLARVRASLGYGSPPNAEAEIDISSVSSKTIAFPPIRP